MRIVETAKGAKLNLDDADMFQRMAVARQTRIRQQACLESKWNVALAGMSDQISIAPDRRRFKLQKEFGELLYKAGLWEEALDQFLRVQEAAPTNIETMMALAQIFSKLGRTDGLVHLENQVKRICCDPEDFRLELELSSRLSSWSTKQLRTFLTHVVKSGNSLRFPGKLTPTQRAQYPLIKHYSLNHNMKPYII